MVSNEKFAVIGGDLRQLYMAKKLKEDGNEIYICGFEKFENLKNLGFENSNLETATTKSKYIILPVPTSKNSSYLNAPFSNAPINIDRNLISKLKNKIVFAGVIPYLFKNVNKEGDFKLIDYYPKEEFLTKNAMLTSQGTIKVILENFDSTIYESKCLIVGYGRIGKILSNLLKNMGANVTISARNPKDIAWAKINDFETINIAEINNNFYFDLIINTVPAPIINAKALNFLKSAKLVIDLASLPGGVDKIAAKNLDIKIIHALGIPGKYFPKNSGEIIADVIYKTIKEENLWKKLN